MCKTVASLLIGRIFLWMGHWPANESYRHRMRFMRKSGTGEGITVESSVHKMSKTFILSRIFFYCIKVYFVLFLCTW